MSYYDEDYAQMMADEYHLAQEEQAMIAEDAYNHQAEESMINDEYACRMERENYDYIESEMFDAIDQYDGNDDYNHLTDEDLYDYFADVPTILFKSGHYKVKNEIFMSIWFYKKRYNTGIDNNNDQNFKDAKEISKKGLAKRRIKVKTNSEKFKTVSGYLKNNLKKYYS